MRDFGWDDFRHFAALAQTLHLGDAAARLKTSQVTVMRRVRALERALGVTLFVRRRDGHRLTPAGAKLLGLAQDAEQVLGEVAVSVAGEDASPLGHVRIATTEVGANWILLPRIGQFRAAHPEIRLEIDASPQALDLLEDSETIALRFHRPQTGNYLIRRLGTMTHGIYATRELLRNCGIERGDDWSKALPHIGWGGPFAEIGLARWLRTAFAGTPPCLTLTTLQGQIDAGRKGHGAIGLPEFIGRRFRDLIKLEGAPDFTLDAWLVIPDQVRRVARIKAAASFVTDAAHAVMPRGDRRPSEEV
jgi:DNA-binding transcriptional LysR family regulator